MQMDKASIVGDAALYVQDLQKQAKKLKAEVASLESSLTRTERQGGIHDNENKIRNADFYPTIKIILQICVCQVEENGYYIRVVSNKGHGVAASLYKALDSLSTFILHSSNLATQNDTFLFTFNLNVRELVESDTNAPNMKLWVAAAFLNQGFDLKQPL
nr:PREDICTED: transcription factor FER-LIKE IRON DEFICIENCY-INDUCED TRANSCRIPTION FACTOR-like [Daucus carota subsp. sativus]